MQRRIVEPADVGGQALAELKNWLGITRQNEDALLTDLLRSSIAMCEAFTGQAPLSQLIEERVPTRAGLYTLSSRPVASFAIAEIVEQSGIRNMLDSEFYEIEIQTSTLVTFRLLDDVEGQAVAVRVRVGLGSAWSEVPAPLKQGIVRLCAHHYRDRDRTGGTKAITAPPASVSALWRPWQLVRLT